MEYNSEIITKIIKYLVIGVCIAITGKQLNLDNRSILILAIVASTVYTVLDIIPFVPL